jgi:hypothetical protein
MGSKLLLLTKCPVCDCINIMTYDSEQVCLKCNHKWNFDKDMPEDATTVN